MARPPTNGSDDSSKENIPTPRVKQEKLRKQGRADEPVEAEQEDGSPHGPKRTRINEDGESRSSPVSDKPKPKTLPRDVDGYIPGSVVRIQLKNFLTYDYAEFRPGPRLNMIIGPNGTGKSSIACALVIGLNWPASILGRSDKIENYVKTHTNAGHIEIELKGKPGQKNIVVRRKLQTDSKFGSFTLNGKNASGKDVTTKMEELNVQIGNLCSFLPQDKVSSFAAMTPQQLLRETQRAAGDENLTRWHDVLIEAGKELKRMSDTIKGDTESLNQMKERNAALEREVARFKERKEIEGRIAYLTVVIAVAEYETLRDEYLAYKKVQRAAHSKVKGLKARNEPAHKFLDQLENKIKEIEKKQDKAKRTSKDNIAAVKRKWTESDSLEAAITECQDAIDNINNEEKRRLANIKKYEDAVAKLEVDAAKQNPVEDEAAVREELRLANQKIAPLKARKGDLESSMHMNVQKKANFQVELDNAEENLRRLDNVANRKLEVLKHPVTQDTYDAIVWLRQNQHRFELPIIEPAAVSTNVTDQRFAAAVEASISRDQLLTFIPQSHADYNLLNRLVNDEGALGRKVKVHTWYRDASQVGVSEPPMTREQMASLGFAGYALDFLTYPEPMEFFLKANVNLHRAAIGVREEDVNVNAAMDAVAKMGGATFITGKTMHVVTRSRYGRKAVSNNTREIHEAKYFASSNVDPAAKARVEATRRDAKMKLDMAEEEHRDIRHQLEAVQREGQGMQNAVDDIIRRQRAITDEMTRRHKAESTLLRQRNALAAAKGQPSAGKKRVEKKNQLLKLGRKRVEVVEAAMQMTHKVIEAHKIATKTGLEALQLAANRAALKERLEVADAAYENALNEFRIIDEEFRRKKKITKDALEASQDIVEQQRDRDSAVVDQMAEQFQQPRSQYRRALVEAEENNSTPPSTEGVDLRTLEELRNALETEQTQLEMTMATNPGVVEQYENRKREIEELEKKLESQQQRAERKEREIKNARDNWKPALEKLVGSIGAKFSAAFDRIGCAGEVRISEHEDFEKWAIDILVKFRDEERLQLLTGQRQSGGERSLTTILYLMSLTEEARAPFSLVDEINQGMDQRAERVVHNNMVQVTCQEDSAQYFLLTPKLLPDLNYHERMKVLCVNNGDWVPENPKMGDLKDLLEGYVRQCDATGRPYVSGEFE